MGRAIAAALVLVFLTQATGLAATPQELDTASLAGNLRFEFANILQGTRASQLAALVSGTETRWEAMHDPAPVIPHATPSDPSATHAAAHTLRTPIGIGSPGQAPPMLTKPLLVTTSSVAAASTMRAARVLSVPNAFLQAAPRMPVRKGGVRALSVTTGSTNVTGINPYWTYYEAPLPGVGKYMVNVGTGNLIVQATDVDISERGIDLAFQRTYNSFGGRDYAADDGSPTPGQYGTRWTNTFDTHLATNSSGGISVFDIDGARYDYTPTANDSLAAAIHSGAESAGAER